MGADVDEIPAEYMRQVITAAYSDSADFRYFDTITFYSRRDARSFER